jgi:hypothetical protein
VTLTYCGTEIEIKKGDQVRFHGEPGEIEFVVSDDCDPETRWYWQEFGGGVMVREPKYFRSAFLDADSVKDTEDLEFVARADPTAR